MISAANSQESPKCLVIAVYFGPLPSYFDLFLRSLEVNSSIDFLLVTDQSIERRPSNLKIESMNLEDFRVLASEMLKMEVTIPRAYKVCDFRPAFGHIFSEQLRNYTHWGHCDLDVVFGDILGTIPSEAFDFETKVLIRGCFALYPNTAAANSWYMTVLPGLDYKRVFSTPNPFHFDESAGILRILEYLDVRIWNEECIFNIEWEHFRLRAVGSSPGYHKYVWQEGRILEYSRTSGTVSNVREALLIHLMKRPMAALDFDASTVMEVHIGPNGFSVTADSDRSNGIFVSRLRLARSGLSHQLRRIHRRLAKRGDLRPIA